MTPARCAARVLFLTLSLSLTAGVAHAGTLTLTAVTVVHQFQQTTNNPCVIGDPSCNNGGFPETILPSGANSYDAFSPVYVFTTAQAAGSFQIGVDINQSNVTQQLSLFTLLVNGVVVDTFSAANTGCTPTTPNCRDVPPTTGGGNGNGYADYLLSGFSAIPANTPFQFHVVMPAVDDGREEFFLIPGPNSPLPNPTPEPASMLLMGTGLLAGRWALRRRKAA